MKKPGSAPQKRRTVHLVSHTHWDREWYHRASVFRQRLVALIDDLRGAARLDPALHFLLDGQTVLLDDYVAVRPNKQTQLHELLRAGVLEAGPWYVLGDELIPEGEVMVRNLLEGRRMLREYGARPTRVLYCPDSFGHPAVLPLIAREFGCTLIVLWRGFGGTDHPKSSVVRWFAPDGTPAVVYHLPPDGYEFGSSLPPDRTKADARWASVKSDLDARDKFGVALLLNGADHHFLQPDYREALSALQGSAQASQVPSSDFADNIRHSSLNGFARALHHKLLGKIVPAVRGELRDSYGYTWCLQGTFASRAYQKRDFALTTRYLLRNCEPWMALAHFRGATSAQSLLRAAWKTLLLCAPHDSICGCSIDAVAREVDLRLADTQAQAEKLQLAALHHLSGYSAAEVRSAPSQGKDYVVIANPSARRRSGVAEVVLTRKVRDIRVGPGSAAQPAPVPVPELPASLVSAGFELSARVPVVELESARAVQLLESPLHYPDADEVINQHLLT